MLVRRILDIMSTRHNISGTRLLNPLGVGNIVTMVTKAIVWTQCLDELRIGGVGVLWYMVTFLRDVAAQYETVPWFVVCEG